MVLREGDDFTRGCLFTWPGGEGGAEPSHHTPPPLSWNRAPWEQTHLGGK